MLVLREPLFRKETETVTVTSPENVPIPFILIFNP